MDTLTQALEDVRQERARQDGKWGGPAHDDTHNVAEYVRLIEDYAGWVLKLKSHMGSAYLRLEVGR